MVTQAWSHTPHGRAMISSYHLVYRNRIKDALAKEALAMLRREVVDSHSCLSSLVWEEDRRILRQIYRALPRREHIVIEMRLGFGDGYVYTLDEVGRRLHVTRERVRQIEADALRRLDRRLWPMLSTDDAFMGVRPSECYLAKKEG